MEPHSARDFGLFDERIHLLGTPPAARIPLRDLMDSALEVRDGIINQTWDSLSASGLRCLGIGHASFAILQETVYSASIREKAEQRQATYFADLFVDAAAGNNAQALLDVLREKFTAADPSMPLEEAISRTEQRLERELDAPLKSKIRSAAKRVDERIDLDASFSRLAEGKTNNVSLLEPSSQRLAAQLERQIEEQSSWVLSCLTRGLLARVHAEFNLAQTRDRAPTGTVDAEETRRAIGAVVAEAEQWLGSGQQRIYCALVNRDSPDDVARVALGLVDEIERRLLNFVRSQSTMRQTMLSLRSRGMGTASERIGRIAARAGMLIREAVASHCASYRLALGVLSVLPPEDVHELIRDTEMTAFSTGLPNGRDVALKDLDVSADGDFVEIEGFVKEIEALRMGDGKLVSRVVLHDPSSDTTANAAAIFAHLPHAGVTLDSFVRVNGLFKLNSNLFAGEPAVEIDTLSLGALRRSDWRIGFLQLAGKWFEPWRNGANMIWSLGPHGIGDDDEGRFGAGELLYLPLFRR